MKYLLSLTLILLITTPSFAIFGNRNRCNVAHHAKVVQVAVVATPRIVTQTKVIIPIRAETYSEVKGLRLLQDIEGNQYTEINGQIINPIGNVNKVTSEIISGQKIIIDQITTQSF